MAQKASSKTKALFWSGRLGSFAPDSPALRMGLTIAVVTASIVIVLITG